MLHVQRHVVSNMLHSRVFWMFDIHSFQENKAPVTVLLTALVWCKQK